MSTYEEEQGILQKLWELHDEEEIKKFDGRESTEQEDYVEEKKSDSASKDLSENEETKIEKQKSGLGKGSIFCRKSRNCKIKQNQEACSCTTETKIL